MVSEPLDSARSKLNLPSERFWRTRNEGNQIKSREKGGRATRHTLFPLVGVAKLLEATANLLWGSMFTGLFEYIFGNEAVPVRESSKGLGGPGIGGLIAGKTFKESNL